MNPCLNVDANFFSPANWPDYTTSRLRVGWISEDSVGGRQAPDIFQLAAHLPMITITTLDWSAARDNLFEIVSFFEKIEVLLLLEEYNTDPCIPSIGAAMGRAVVADSSNLFPFNHGDTGLVVANSVLANRAENLAKALIYLKADPTLRATLGKSLRRKYLELQKVGN